MHECQQAGREGGEAADRGAHAALDASGATRPQLVKAREYLAAK